jgi:hypothetical protein
VLKILEVEQLVGSSVLKSSKPGAMWFLTREGEEQARVIARGEMPHV